MAVYKRGVKWYVRYSHNGKDIRKAVGPSKKWAETVLKDIETKILKGEHLGIHEEKKMLFSAFSEKYLEYSKANKAPNSYRRDIHLIKNLNYIFGGEYLHNISARGVEEYKSKRLEDGVKPATVNREVSCLRNMYNKARGWGYYSKNPVQGVKMMKEPPGRIRFLEKEEIHRLLDAAESLPGDSGSYLKPIIVIALNTGFRKNEILQLKWKNIDFKNRRISVFRSKTNEIGSLPMNEMLWRELKNAPRHPESEYIFCNKKGNPYNNVRKSFDRALRVAGVENFVFHDLRHTFASHLVMSRADIRTVQQLMGHKDIKMTMKYSHLSKNHIDSAVEVLGKTLAQIRHNIDSDETETMGESAVSSRNTEG